MPASAYAQVPLRNLDGSGYLRGKWVVVKSSTGTPAYSAQGRYFYDRHQDQFEQVMGYFWVNQAQEYLQSLGFGVPAPAPASSSSRSPSRSTSTAATTATRPTSPTGSGSARAGSTTPRTPR